MRGGDDLFGTAEHADVAPAVVSPEHVDQDQSGSDVLSPETVYIPSERVRDRHAEVTLELRALDDGSLAMLAYTSLEELVACCGEGQPWVAVCDYEVEGLRTLSGAELVSWDAALPIEQRRGRFEEASS